MAKAIDAKGERFNVRGRKVRDVRVTFNRMGERLYFTVETEPFKFVYYVVDGAQAIIEHLATDD